MLSRDHEDAHPKQNKNKPPVNPGGKGIKKLMGVLAWPTKIRKGFTRRR